MSIICSELDRTALDKISSADILEVFSSCKALNISIDNASMLLAIAVSFDILFSISALSCNDKPYEYDDKHEDMLLISYSMQDET